MNADGTNKRQVTKLNAASFRSVLYAGWQEDNLLHELFRDRSA